MRFDDDRVCPVCRGCGLVQSSYCGEAHECTLCAPLTVAALSLEAKPTRRYANPSPRARAALEALEREIAAACPCGTDDPVVDVQDGIPVCEACLIVPESPPTRTRGRALGVSA